MNIEAIMAEKNKMPQYNPISDVPNGVEHALFKIMRFHVGRANAISRDDLCFELGQMGYRVQDRAMRAAINQLRHAGNPICSSGDASGYWLASDWDELDEFLEREIHPRAMDLLEQESALKKSAEMRWGQYSRQERMW